MPRYRGMRHRIEEQGRFLAPYESRDVSGGIILEMFFWTTPFAARTFGKSPEFLESTAAMAANQGLYNGFLAAGLIWGILIDSGRVLVFFCSCVVVAGVFGAATVKPSIFFIQALPAAIALIAAVVVRRGARQ